MHPRRTALILLLLPILLFGGAQLADRRGTALFPGLDPAEVQRIEMARGRRQVVLARRADTGRWAVLSAADAPADPARVQRLLDQLARLRGTPLDGAPPAREPLELRLSDRAGRTLGHAAFLPGEARALPDGPRLALGDLPALPLWQAAWARIEAPRITRAEIVAVRGAGGRRLAPADEERVRALLAGLSGRDFVAAGAVNWAGATMAQATLADGSLVDLQQVPDGERYLVRLTSDRRADVRAARVYAFRSDIALATAP